MLAEEAVEGVEGEQEGGCALVLDVLVVKYGGAVPVLVDGRLDRVLTALQQSGVVNRLVLARAVQEEHVCLMQGISI